MGRYGVYVAELVFGGDRHNLRDQGCLSLLTDKDSCEIVGMFGSVYRLRPGFIQFIRGKRFIDCLILIRNTLLRRKLNYS